MIVLGPEVMANAHRRWQRSQRSAVGTPRARLRPSTNIGNALIYPVGSIAARRFIWETIKNRVDLFADSRLAFRLRLHLCIASYE